MIEVENLTKDYGSFQALRDVTFSVERGEILGFLGPNGAGKTTTMRIITGFIPATSGSVRVAGYDVADKSLEARKHLGYLPETVPLYMELTPTEYLDFRARITGITGSRERKARIGEVMDRLNIVDVANKQIGNLSRGYRQRVGLAQAMLHNPDVLILDEPTVGLDPVQITGVRELIRELGQDHTVILSTHILAEVSMVCDRVVIINRGRLVALDTPVHLASTATESQTVHLEVAGSPSTVLAALRTAPSVASAGLLSADGQNGTAAAAESLPAGTYNYQVEGAPGADVRSGLASAIVGSGNQLLELKVYRPSLEDIFISVISQDEQAAAEGAYDEDEWTDDGSDDGDVEDGEPDAPKTKQGAAEPKDRVVTRRRVRG
ncbi:MAG: gliding motility-associated transport system ATP-binding protein [Chloroflexia bacterium]|jgi:ABC-2 type transport system ATP-binding protein|nr:gliding motility-associated transport system ATP-binding protein [Chloroflexia bacterium]